MQYTNDFYLTLPSNVNVGSQYLNKTNSYTTPLPATIELNGSWECGIAEITYPHSWDNVRENNNVIQIIYHVKNENPKEVKEVKEDKVKDDDYMAQVKW